MINPVFFCVWFSEYLFMLFGFVLVSGVISLCILVNSFLVHDWIAYLLASWWLSSHNEDIVEFWYGARSPFVYIFQDL